MAYYRTAAQNPRPVYPNSGRQLRQKSDVAELLQQNQKQCCEIEALMEAYEVFLALPDQAVQPGKMREFLSAQDSYRDEIVFSGERELKFFSLTERPRGRDLLAAVDGEFAEKLLNIGSLQEAETLLKSKLQQNGLEFNEFEFKIPIPADMRRVIRMEFDGAIEKPDEDILSPGYKNRERTEISDGSAYPLETSPAWQKFAKFENFRRMESEVREALAAAEIAPELVKEMRVADFEDVLWQYRNAKQPEEYKDQPRINVFEGSRNFFVKMFIANHEDEFREVLKSLGCNEKTADYAVDKLKKGKLPKIQLPGNKYLVPTVHHDHAIQDAGQLKDPTAVNNVDNLRMMFDVRDGNLRNVDYTYTPPVKLELSGEADLNLLAGDENAKKKYVKKLAAENFEAIFKAMRGMGVDSEKISEFILEMHRSGTVKAVENREGHYIGLDLKKTEYGMRLVLSEKEQDNGRARGMHKDIMHGIDGAPLSVEYSNADHKVLPANGAEQQNAYEVEGVKGKGSRIVKLLKRISFKRNPDKRKPMALIAAFNKIIYANDRDTAAAERRFARQREGLVNKNSAERQ